MANDALLQLADILPAPAASPAVPTLGWLLLIAGITGLVLVGWWLLRRRRLLRALRAGRLSARQVLHELARQRGADDSRRAVVDALRFARDEPDIDVVIALIKRGGR